MSDPGSNNDPPASSIPESSIEESAEELYEMAPCGYLTTAVDGRILKVNRTLAEWLGYESAELTGGKRFVDLLTIGGRMFYETHFNLLLRMQKAVDEIALDIVRKDGTVIPALINARQKRNAAEEPVLNRFTVFNSTERRMYERQLLSARDILRTTLSSIGDGVVSTDEGGRITLMNPVAEQLTGWKEGDARGKSIEEVMVLVREDDSSPIENPIRQALQTGLIVGLTNHTVLLSRDGRRLPVDDSASPIRDANDQIVGSVLVFRDISERRLVELQLADAYRKLDLNAGELRRSNEELSQFAHVASHDLRSPLNNIMSFAQLLERSYGEELGEGKELLGFLIAGAKRMAALIEDLLVYARVSANDDRLRTPTDANLPVKSAMDNLQADIEQSGAKITTDPLPLVGVDETSLVQLFQNLIGNAIRYRGSAAPEIHISAVAQENEWLFSCRDNGIGISPEYYFHIFEPFKRLHGVELPGSGIGLAVCKKITARYRGRIWVESELHKGSTFFFTLPRGAD